MYTIAMEEKTVTVGDTEVQISETEDGFEVTEVDEMLLDQYDLQPFYGSLSDEKEETAERIAQAFKDSGTKSLDHVESFGTDANRGVSVNMKDGKGIGEMSGNMSGEFLEHNVAIYGVHSDEKFWMAAVENLEEMS